MGKLRETAKVIAEQRKKLWLESADKDEIRKWHTYRWLKEETGKAIRSSPLRDGSTSNLLYAAVFNELCSWVREEAE